jgi:glycosyltransferase involved in cell wall biosynthesis
VSEVYAKPSTLIAYGGDHVIREIEEEKKEKILSDYGLKKQDYAVCVCRIEPENNCHISLEAFSKSDKKIVFIGNWNHSEYSKRLKKQYASYPNIHLLDAIYDLDILYVIRSNASIYVHGHSAGGTNPSLVEAMFFGMPIVAYDCVYNRATTHDKAYYFKDTADLMGLLSNDLDGSSMRSIAEKNYMWKDIALQYEQTY